MEDQTTSLKVREYHFCDVIQPWGCELNFARTSLWGAMIFSFCFVVLSGTPSCAQKFANHRLSPVQVQAVDDLLAPLRPEYQADLTFEVLDRAGDSLSKMQQEQLIRRVFENSIKAKYPFPTIDASHTRIGLTHQIATNLRLNGMDTLDIQTKAVGRALTISPKLARELFEGISLRAPRGYACQTRPVANVAAYYQTAGLLIRDSRLQTIAFNQSPTLFLTALAKSMDTPIEVLPLARLLSDKTLSVKDLEPALASFLSALSLLAATDREMAVMEDNGQLTQAIGSVADVYKASGASELPLLQSYREFLIRSLRPEQCGDYSVDREEVVKRFNDLVRQRLGGAPSTFSFLSADELRPLRRSDVSQDLLTPIAHEIMPRMMRIMDIKRANQVHDFLNGSANSEPQQPDDADMRAVLDYALSSESRSPGCPLCDFEARMTTLIMLLSYLPAGDALNRTVDLSIDNFLANSTVEDEEPDEWIKMMRNLLNIGRTPDEKGRAVIEDAIKQDMLIILGPSPAANEVKLRMEQSPDPVIHSYATVERMLPIPYKTSNRF